MDTLADLLQRREGRLLDFKREEVALPKALKTLVAVANTAGGCSCSAWPKTGRYVLTQSSRAASDPG